MSENVDYRLTWGSEALNLTCLHDTILRWWTCQLSAGMKRSTTSSVTRQQLWFTVFIHLVNHLLQLLRCRVLAEHPHHLPQLLGADAAVLRILHEDVKGGLELCNSTQRETSLCYTTWYGPSSFSFNKLFSNVWTKHEVMSLWCSPFFCSSVSCSTCGTQNVKR